MWTECFRWHTISSSIYVHSMAHTLVKNLLNERYENLGSNLLIWLYWEMIKINKVVSECVFMGVSSEDWHVGQWLKGKAYVVAPASLDQQVHVWLCLGFQTLDSKFLSEQTHNSNSPGSFQAFGTGPDCIIDQPFCVLRLPDQWTEQQLASLPLQCSGGYHWVTPSPIIQAIDRNLCMCYITGSFLLVNFEGMIVMAYIQLILMDELENRAKE